MAYRYGMMPRMMDMAMAMPMVTCAPGTRAAA